MNILDKVYLKLNNLLFKEVRKNSLLVKINTAFSRGAATALLRKIDNTNPASWEFSAFSQNGEDGIIDYLISQLKVSNRYFIEIGANNCIDNNTGWLAYGKNFSGIMIEGDEYTYKTSVDTKPWYTNYLNQFVTLENIHELSKTALYKNPDLLSLDIDGNDYYIMDALLQQGFRPKIAVVEYNSCYGPHRSMTIQYKPDFYCFTAHSTVLYYGVSISLWRQLFHKYGYRFISVESNGVNAFFIHPDFFTPEFVDNINPNDFKENAHQLRKFNQGWEYQFSLIQEMPFYEV